VSIALGVELFHEQLRTGSGYLLGAVISLAVLAAGVIMLSVWAPPQMTPEALDRLPGAVRRSVKASRRRATGTTAAVRATARSSTAAGSVTTVSTSGYHRDR
jgi:hypothetical protein